MIRNDIPKPDISSDFTINDIHKIREWNYERMKEATRSEIIDYYRRISEVSESERNLFRNRRK